MIDPQRLTEQLIHECEQGCVELWSVIWVVRHALNDDDYPTEDRSDPAEVRKVTLDLVRSMLDSGKVQAGGLSDDETKFEAWPVTVDEAIDRIDAEWDTLGHEPDMEDIVAIFTSTKG